MLAQIFIYIPMRVVSKPDNYFYHLKESAMENDELERTVGIVILGLLGLVFLFSVLESFLK